MHVTYCLNIHPGLAWSENFEAIRRYVPQVRARIAPNRPFGLGLRLGAAAAEELGTGKRLDEFAAFLRENRLYVFTINGFPFGPFHGRPVKEAVYVPDWRAPERMEYTVRLAEILARLLPPGVPGSISTLPGMYGGPERRGPDAEIAVFPGILEAADRIRRIAARARRRILLAVEPEPDCLWQNSAEFLAAFRRLRSWAERRGRATALEALGLCLDACHEAVEFRSPLAALRACAAANVPVAKVQISAALRAGANSAAARRRLAEFADPVYLHQTRVRLANGERLAFPDLPAALAALETLPRDCEIRSHVHVPLCTAGYGGLESTRRTLSAPFFAALRAGASPHLELETYTFDVLPAELRRGGVVAALVREFQWLLPRLEARTAQAGA